MIVALEGPDCCGKSTLFAALGPLLPEAKFVRSWHLPKALLPVARELEARNDHLWRQLYDAAILYVTDRFVAVSAQVYGALYDREPHDFAFWRPHLYVVYLDVPVEELKRRREATGDYFDPTKYDACVRLYRSIVRQFVHTTLDGTGPVDTVAQEVLRWTRTLRGGG